MNEWDDLDEWVDEIIEDTLVEAKTEASKIFLENVTSPTTFQSFGPSSLGGSGYTPVLTGNLLGNTEVGINKFPDGVNASTDTSGKETFFDGFIKAKSAGAWDTINFVNATPYNVQAEFTGWNRTGPYRYWELSYNNTWESVK